MKTVKATVSRAKTTVSRRDETESYKKAIEEAEKQNPDSSPGCVLVAVFTVQSATNPPPGTGFTHIAGVSRRGEFQLKRRTSRKKRNAKLASLREEMRERRHEPVRAQHAWLSSVLEGHFRYYGVPTNYRALQQFRERVRASWHRQLQRRSQRAHWSRQQRTGFEQRFPLLQPRIHHPWPALPRASPSTRGGSPVREIRSPGSVRGAVRVDRR
ncbi:hypothetical protein WME75_16475 [Sorangium sp. So ce1014]|uniref:hypothetical protein n=1 Tax=Sorangium sp. So ce1014 TaxID=3133326 RepID=UPI003F635565